MAFAALPSELVLETASYLDDTSVGRLLRTNWQYRHLLKGELHKRAIADRLGTHCDTYNADGSIVSVSVTAIEWAVQHSKVSLVRYLLAHDKTCLDSDAVTRSVLEWIRCGQYFEINTTTEIVINAREKGRLRDEGWDESCATGLLCEAIAQKRAVYERSWPRVQNYDSKRLRLIDLLLPESLACSPTPTQYRTLLYDVIYEPEVFKSLLRHGPDLNHDSEPYAPLLSSLIRNGDDSSGLARLVLEAGADPNIRRNKDVDVPPLIEATMYGRYTTAMTLLEFGASVKPFETAHGPIHSPLFLAIEHCSKRSRDIQVPYIRKLLEYGADPNFYHIEIQNFGSETKRYILDAAVSRESHAPLNEKAELVNLLINHGADPDLLDKDVDGRNFLQRYKARHLDHDSMSLELQVIIKTALIYRLPQLLPAEWILQATDKALGGFRFNPIGCKRCLEDFWAVLKATLVTFTADDININIMHGMLGFRWEYFDELEALVGGRIEWLDRH